MYMRLTFLSLHSFSVSLSTLHVFTCAMPMNPRPTVKSKATAMIATTMPIKKKATEQREQQQEALPYDAAVS